jgi:hypothetical protein
MTAEPHRIDVYHHIDGFDDAARRLLERDNALDLIPTLRRIA